MKLNIIPKFIGKQYNGKLYIDDTEGFRNWLKGLGPGDLEIVVRQHKLTRSDRQNRYMWGVVYEMISEHTGMTPTAIHEYLKTEFLTEKHIMKMKGDYVVEVDVPRSSSVLKTNEFEDYLSKVRQWASQELGIYVPLPHEAMPEGGE